MGIIKEKSKDIDTNATNRESNEPITGNDKEVVFILITIISIFDSFNTAKHIRRVKRTMHASRERERDLSV